MKLSEILARPPEFRRIEVRASIVPLDRAVTSFQRRFDVFATAEDTQDLEVKLNGFKDRYIANDWSSFPWNKASELFRLFFVSNLRDDEKWSKVATILLDTLRDTDKKSYCRAALDVYIETFNHSAQTLDRLHTILKNKEVGNIPIRRNLIDDFQLFNPEVAPYLIGREMANSDTPYRLVKSWGIWSPHASGLFENAFQKMLEYSEQNLMKFDQNSFERVMNWLCPDSNTKAEASRIAGIEAILLPLKNDTSSILRNDVEKFLVKSFGDPRVTPANWAGVSEEVIQIINSWLTSKSLKMFFEIISRFQGSHMWEPRRKFWTAINEREWINDAWVVLNTKGARYAKQLAQEHEDNAFLSHGSLNFTEIDKCFFIMRVGNLTIVEGTHNFRVRIFDNNAPFTPQLRLNSYNRNEIHATPAGNSGAAFTHDVNGRWMQNAEDYMRRNR